MKLLVSLVAIFAIVSTIANVNASGSGFATIQSIEVNGVTANSFPSTLNVGAIAGQIIPVQVNFYGNSNASNVRLKAWVAGSSDYSYSSDRFDVYSGSTYSSTVALQVPSNIDPTEGLQVYVSLESQDSGQGDQQYVSLAAQRQSYSVDILAVNSNSQVQAGDNLALDIVLKNDGSHNADNTFVKATIPELGVSQTGYFGDMSPVDSTDFPDSIQDSAERQLSISIPSSAQPGVYTVQIEAYNGDTSTTATQKIAVLGAGANSIVAPDTQSRSFAAGTQGTYTLTLVNSGDKIQVYNLVVQNANDALNVNVDQPVVAVPAGSSKNVQVTAMSSQTGNYPFSVNVQSSGSLVSTQNFNADVISSTGSLAGSTAVVLTVILAIVFIVLLVVLIVLLTRKPEKTQEFGESYY